MALDGLLKHLQAGIGYHATPPVGRLPHKFLVTLTIVHHRFVGDVDTAKAHDAFSIGAVVETIGGKAGADAKIEHIGIELGDLGLLGQGEGIGRIGKCDERVGAGPSGFVDHGRKVRGADRVGDVIDNVEPGFGEGFTGRGDEIDAETVGHGNDGNVIVDNTGIALLNENVGQSVSVVTATAKQPEAAVPAFDEFGRAVGHGRNGELRIAEAVK